MFLFGVRVLNAFRVWETFPPALGPFEPLLASNICLIDAHCGHTTFWFPDPQSPQIITVTIISIRTTNFGWARPNRVLSQAVFQKFAAGRPKFGAEREVRASPWGFALAVSRLKRSARPKNRSSKNKSQVGGMVSAGMSDRASAMNAHKQ
jgi:hypothetical protein